MPWSTESNLSPISSAMKPYSSFNAPKMKKSKQAPTPISRLCTRGSENNSRISRPAYKEISWEEYIESNGEFVDLKNTSRQRVMTPIEKASKNNSSI